VENLLGNGKPKKNLLTFRSNHIMMISMDTRLGNPRVLKHLTYRKKGYIIYICAIFVQNWLKPIRCKGFTVWNR